LWLVALSAVFLPASSAYLAALKALANGTASILGLVVTSGPQGLSAWLLPAFAVLLAARVPWRHRLGAVAALLAASLVLDIGIVVAVAAVRLSPAAAQPVYAAAQALLPFLGVIAFTRGDSRRLWSASAA
jgi:hypothetical protein